MKLLVRIAPIIVILACAGSFFFAKKVNEIKLGLLDDKARLTADLNQTKTTLAKTQADLKQTQTDLQASRDETSQVKAQYEAEQVKVAQKSKEIEDLTAQKNNLDQQLADAMNKATQAEAALTKMKEALAAVGFNDVTDIASIAKKVESLTDENKMLGEKLAAAVAEKTKIAAELEEERKTPVGLRGRIALAKSMWNFVVLDLGHSQHVRGTPAFLVYRDAKLVSKVKVTTINPNTSVAEMVPGFTTGTVREGDIVIYDKM